MPPRSLDWKHEVSQLVASHRSRRIESTHFATRQPSTQAGQSAAHDRAARIAASVAARYAAAPTYSDLLQQRRAAEAVASAAADTPTILSDSFATSASTLWEEELSTDPIARAKKQAQISMSAAAEADVDHDALDVLDMDLGLEFEPAPEPRITGTLVLPDLPTRSAEINMHAPEIEPEPELEDLLASSLIAPPVLLPANLIEFPRELIAPRRARPQLAEGPLGSQRTAAATETAQIQLRIFEVESNIEAETDPSMDAETADTAHDKTTESTVEQPRTSAWASICLDAQPNNLEQFSAEAHGQLPVPPQSASIDRRLMAAAVDFCIVTGAFLAFLLVFALSTPHLPTGKPAVLMGGVVYLALWVLYQFLFFSLGDATAGMHYARIALCTFDDENPSRSALRGRIAAWWISALPLGLGFGWALLDEDSLSWHDRMTRIYQRSY